MLTQNIEQRIVSLDVLRGIALCGILLMNIQSFGLPMAAYSNPTAYGDLNGVNYWAWLFTHLFADQKFLSIFSMLFGIGVCVFMQRAEAKGFNAASLHKRRMCWLLLFGLLHAYLIWFGDILFSYAICGFIVVSLRNSSTKKLLLLSVLFTAGFIPFNLLFGGALEYMPVESLAGLSEVWSPTEQQLQNQIDQVNSSWSQQIIANAGNAVMMQTFVFATYSLWRITGMMLLGMAIFKAGILTEQKARGFYMKMALICSAVGLSLTLLGVQQNQAHEFAMSFSMFYGSLYNYIGSVFMALSYVALVMLIICSGRFLRFKKAMAVLGKTAFSNYILQSVICVLFFYGFGLGLFAELSRFDLLMCAIAIWVLQISVSLLWLNCFRFGPLEWLWRGLTYRRFDSDLAKH